MQNEVSFNIFNLKQNKDNLKKFATQKRRQNLESLMTTRVNIQFSNLPFSKNRWVQR